jgi:hypothetical protein
MARHRLARRYGAAEAAAGTAPTGTRRQTALASLQDAGVGGPLAAPLAAMVAGGLGLETALPRPDADPPT